MGDPRLEQRTGRIGVVQVGGIVVAGHRGEGVDVGVCDRMRDLGGFTYVDIFQAEPVHIILHS